MSNQAEHFVLPTEGLLNGLGPGCFVQVERDGDDYWVEIESVVTDRIFMGTVHADLDGTKKSKLDPGKIAFLRDEIKLLGCDRYCFC